MTTKQSKIRFTPANPGPVAQSFARYVAEHFAAEHPELAAFAGEEGPAIAQALFSYHKEWQSWRNQPGGEAEMEKQQRDEERALEQGAKLVNQKQALLDKLAAIEAAEKAAAKATKAS